MIYVSEDFLERIAGSATGPDIGIFEMGVDALWLQIYFGDLIPEAKKNIPAAKEAFLYVLGKLLERGRVKLARGGQFMQGSIPEQLQAFRDAWPPDDVFDADLFCYTIPYIHEGEQEPEIDDWLPADLVWVDDDGSLAWS